MALRAGVVAAEPGHTLPLAAGGIALAAVVASSTVRAGWVSGAVALPTVAILGALTGSIVGLSRARGSVSLVLASAPAPIAALLAVHSQPAQASAQISWHVLVQSGREFVDGQPLSDPAVLLFLLYMLFWLLGVWLAWGTLDRRQPLLAVAPAGAALATNVLNFPDGQDAYVFWFVVTTFALLLWSTYQTSLATARRHRVALHENARWDFWERGAVAAAALVALGVLAPPLSFSDRTVDVQNGLSDTWGRITHSAGASATTSVGFSTSASLGGALARDNGVVLDYTVNGDAPGPNYFRGVDLEPLLGEWSFVPRPATIQHVLRGNEVDYGETYVAEQRAAYTIDMRRPPVAAPDMLVAPGRFDSANRDVQVSQSRLRNPNPFDATLDAVDEITASSGRGSYQIQVEESIASEEELRDDPAAYPDWVTPYLRLPTGYRPVNTMRRIHDLAVRVTAGATNPYDRAAAIEQYLRSNYSYTLTPGRAPIGTDAEDYFLFSSKAGYCQYFATAMADMLRSIGIPTRLVNGYGPGGYDAQQRRFVVRESDAHTWPEVYFPSYGWIAFEPTPDGVYNPIQRGAGAGVSCSGDGCQSDTGSPLTTPAPAATPPPRTGPEAPAVTGGSGTPALPALRTWTPIGALVLLLLVLVYVLASRFLRPQTVAGVWRRAMLLLQLAGVHQRVGETPIEFGDRVAGAFPEAATGMRQLAGDYAVAVYAPPRLAEGRRAAILAGWGSLRPLLLRRIAARLRRRQRPGRRI
jgi:transglutaminase-like putative cysteine protease